MHGEMSELFIWNHVWVFHKVSLKKLLEEFLYKFSKESLEKKLKVALNNFLEGIFETIRNEKFPEEGNSEDISEENHGWIFEAIYAEYSQKIIGEFFEGIYGRSSERNSCRNFGSYAWKFSIVIFFFFRNL